ncbi:hypothetical protein SAMN05660485_03606 [Blastococcus fimeti]|nr:hypothetical protein SAMN05660485_03606 [Blastococcus fimeti]
MHLHLPHLPVPAVLLSVVYAAAVAVALAHPGEHTLAGLVVLAGLVGRWALRSRHPAAAPVALAVAESTGAVDAVLPAEPAVPAAAA